MILYFLFVIIPLLTIFILKNNNEIEKFWGISPYSNRCFKPYNFASLNNNHVIKKTHNDSSKGIKNKYHCYLDKKLNRWCRWTN